MLPNTAVDIAVVLIILLSAGLAFVRGFVREALALGTWLLAIYLGFTKYELLSPFLEQKVSNPNIRDFLAGIGVFAGVMIILIPIGFFVRSFIKGENVTAIDRSLGFVFGAARGFLLISILYLIVSWLVPEEKQPEWLKEANTRPIMVYGADMVRAAIPAEQRKMLEKKPDSGKEGDTTTSGEENTTEDGKKAEKKGANPFDDIINSVKKGP